MVKPNLKTKKRQYPITYITQHSHIFARNKVNGNSFSTKPTASPNTMNIILTIGWQIIIDNLFHEQEEKLASVI